MLGVYLGAWYARHPNYKIVYNDVNTHTHPDILGDMLQVDLNQFDFAIATPPCNYWTHARSNTHPSDYAMKTKHLLPDIMAKLSEWNKPFIIENVRNAPRFEKEGIFQIVAKNSLFMHYIGRHTYFTNIMVDLTCEQEKDFTKGGICLSSYKNKQGGKNVHKVIELWLKHIHTKEFFTNGN